MEEVVELLAGGHPLQGGNTLIGRQFRVLCWHVALVASLWRGVNLAPLNSLRRIRLRVRSRCGVIGWVAELVAHSAGVFQRVH